MRALDKNLTIVSEAERQALYGLPDFDEFQRAEYFALTQEERAIASKHAGFTERLACMLQIGYFKAKQSFFQFRLTDIPAEDIQFLMGRYFPGQFFRPKSIQRNAFLRQRREILRLFGYRSWSDTFLPQIGSRAAQLTMRDVTPAFILAELIALLRQEKIVRPAYNTLQAVISDALTAERQRLSAAVEKALDRNAKAALKQLLVRDQALSKLAEVKQDAKNFGYRMMTLEREKRAAIAPLFQVAKDAVPRLEVSQQNVGYYASLANYYTIYDLRRLKPEQAHLYLLCYSWQRYRQFTDNLVDAFDYHMKQIEDETKEAAEQQFNKALVARQRETPRVGQLLLLYVDDALKDATPFGSVRRQAFRIIPKDTLLGCRQAPVRQARQPDGTALAGGGQAGSALQKTSATARHGTQLLQRTADSPWLAALRWMKSVFARQQRLAQRPLREIPKHSIPEPIASVPAELRPGRQADRRCTATATSSGYIGNCANASKSANIYLDDSLQHRRFSR